jgi:hypothetical protein
MEHRITKDTKITSLEAYKAMFMVIEEYNKTVKSDDINGLLSDMSLVPCGTAGYDSADSAIMYDWERFLELVLEKQSDNREGPYFLKLRK